MESNFDILVKHCLSMKVITELIYKSYGVEFRLKSSDNSPILIKDKTKEAIAIEIRKDIINGLNKVYNKEFYESDVDCVFNEDIEEIEKIANRLVPLIPIIKGDYSFSKDASDLFYVSVNQLCMNYLDKRVNELNRLLTSYFDYANCVKNNEDVSDYVITSKLFMFYQNDGLVGHGNMIAALNANCKKNRKVKVKNV